MAEMEFESSDDAHQNQINGKLPGPKLQLQIIFFLIRNTGR